MLQEVRRQSNSLKSLFHPSNSSHLFLTSFSFNNNVALPIGE